MFRRNFLASVLASVFVTKISLGNNVPNRYPEWEMFPLAIQYEGDKLVQDFIDYHGVNPVHSYIQSRDCGSENCVFILVAPEGKIYTNYLSDYTRAKQILDYIQEKYKTRYFTV